MPLLDTLKRLPIFGRILSVVNNPMLLGVVAQASSSGVSFVLNLVLVATLTPDKFGAYSMAITVVYFLSGFGAAAWTTQVTVFDKATAELSRLLHFKSHLPPFKVMTLLSVASLLLLREGGVIPLVIYVVLCAYGFFLKEYLIRFTYNSNNLKSTAGAQVIFAMGSLGCFALIRTFLSERLFEGTFAALMVGNYCAFYYIYLSARFAQSGRAADVDFSRYLKPGLYGALSHVLSCLRNYGYVYISPIFIGVGGLAEINAARVTTSISSITTPPLTQIHQAKMVRHEADAEIIKSRRNVMLVALATSLPIVLAYPYLSRTLLSQYDDLLVLVVLWCVQALVAAYRSTLEVEVLVQHMFRLLSVTNTVSLFCTVILMTLLSMNFGAIGALCALIASEVIACVVFKVLKGRV